MSIVASELQLFSCASRPEDDASLTGGVRSTTARPSFTQLTANSVVAVISDGADVRTITITGRSATGAVVSEALVLNGNVEVVGVQVFERIQKVVAGATSGTRIVTVKQGSGGSTVGTLPVNELSFHMLFINSASETGAATRYEKLAWYNANAATTLTSAQIVLTADPAARIRIGVCAAKNDATTIANRKASPGLVLADDNVAQDCPGTTLEALSYCGFFVAQELLAGDAPFKNSFTTKLQGNTV